jgi:hypothetical protein
MAINMTGNIVVIDALENDGSSREETLQLRSNSVE